MFVSAYLSEKFDVFVTGFSRQTNSKSVTPRIRQFIDFLI